MGKDANSTIESTRQGIEGGVEDLHQEISMDIEDANNLLQRAVDVGKEKGLFLTIPHFSSERHSLDTG